MRFSMIILFALLAIGDWVTAFDMAEMVARNTKLIRGGMVARINFGVGFMSVIDQHEDFLADW